MTVDSRGCACLDEASGEAYRTQGVTVTRTDFWQAGGVARAPREDPGDNAGEVRCSWSSRAGGDHAVDGGWWPRTADFAVEFRELGEPLSAGGRGPVTLLQANITDWTATPQLVTGPSGPVSVSWFTELFEHFVVAYCASGRRLTLLVVPPDTDTEVARRALALAADPETASLGDEILAVAGVPSAVSFGRSIGVGLRRLGYRLRSPHQISAED